MISKTYRVYIYKTGDESLVDNCTGITARPDAIACAKVWLKHYGKGHFAQVWRDEDVIFHRELR